MKNVILQVVFFTIPFLFQFTSGFAQKYLQIEKLGKAKTEKLPIGTEIEYLLAENEDFLRGVIEGFNFEEQLLVMGDRYVKLSDIVALRFDRSAGKVLGTSLFWFGVGWSAFGLIGTATDGNPDTNYRWSDAIITGTAMLSALVFSKTLRYKVINTKKRYRLRLINLEFGNQ